MGHSPSLDISGQVRAVQISFAVGVTLMLIKFYAWKITHSAAVLSDALESIVNVIASGFAWYSIKLSSRPKNQSYPYGYGKIEFFSAGLEGGLILIAGLVMCYEGIISLIEHPNISQPDLGAALILGSSAVNLGVGYFLFKLGKRDRTLALEAEGSHLMADSLTSLAVVIGLVVVWFTNWLWADGLFALLLGLYIIKEGHKLLFRSILGLLDFNPPEIVHHLSEILEEKRQPDWIDFHHLRIQQFGHTLHLDAHLTLPSYYSLERVHQLTHELESVISKGWEKEVELYIHADPCKPSCCFMCGVQNCEIRTKPQVQKSSLTPEAIVAGPKHQKV